MGHACCQQSNGRHFFRLAQLRFEFNALGNVVNNDEAANHVELSGDQGCNGNIGGAGVAGGRMQAELVEVVNAGVLPHAVKLFHEQRRKNVAELFAKHLGPRHGIHHFHLRIPGFHPVFQVNRQHAYVDGFHNVLIEILEPLVLAGFLFQRGI